LDLTRQLDSMLWGLELLLDPMLLSVAWLSDPRHLKYSLYFLYFFLHFKKIFLLIHRGARINILVLRNWCTKAFIFFYIYIKLTSTPLFLLKITQILWIINLHVFVREWVSTLYNWIHLITNGIKFGSLLLGVIIFCLVWFLPIKTTKPNFYNSKKFKPKPVRTDRFRFGLVF
jgi:hypothetical protein